VATENRGLPYSGDQIENTHPTPIRVNLSLSNKTNRAKSGTNTFNPVNEPIDDKDFFKEENSTKYIVNY